MYGFKQNGCTALMYASQNGYKEIIEILLKMPNIDINVKDNVYFMLFIILILLFCYLIIL